MERETFLNIAERVARYPSVQRRGQLVRPLSPAPVPTTFFAGLAARAEAYGGFARR